VRRPARPSSAVEFAAHTTGRSHPLSLVRFTPLSGRRRLTHGLIAKPVTLALSALASVSLESPFRGVVESPNGVCSGDSDEPSPLELTFALEGEGGGSEEVTIDFTDACAQAATEEPVPSFSTTRAYGPREYGRAPEPIGRDRTPAHR